MRITIIKGEGGLWGDKGINDSLLIFTDDLKEDDKELKITISPFKINSHSPITGVKSTCYINNILSLKEIKNKGFDEAMVLNEDGYIAEAIMANIFWINNGIVYTPSLNTGCLPGITRDIILEIIRDLGIYIKEGEFGLNEIKDAKEIFLTSCIKGVKPVRYINDRAFEIDNNSLTSIIINRFKEIINEEYICGYDKGNGFCR
jgi:branched-subunit amino acid aminotransferase/4-amino-4-deoxychorismate lyase